MFTYLFGSAGYLNEILHRLGAIDTPIDWLGGDWYSLGVILTAELWKVTPLVTLILLAGLESVPESALEDAALTGPGCGADSGTSRFRCCVRRFSRP